MNKINHDSLKILNKFCKALHGKPQPNDSVDYMNMNYEICIVALQSIQMKITKLN